MNDPIKLSLDQFKQALNEHLNEVQLKYGKVSDEPNANTAGRFMSFKRELPKKSVLKKAKKNPKKDGLKQEDGMGSGVGAIAGMNAPMELEEDFTDFSEPRRSMYDEFTYHVSIHPMQSNRPIVEVHSDSKTGDDGDYEHTVAEELRTRLNNALWNAGQGHKAKQLLKFLSPFGFKYTGRKGGNKLQFSGSQKETEEMIAKIEKVGNRNQAWIKRSHPVKESLLREDLYSDEHVQAWSHYAPEMQFISEEDARQWITKRIVTVDERLGHVWGEAYSREVAATIPLFQNPSGFWKINLPKQEQVFDHEMMNETIPARPLASSVTKLKKPKYPGDTVVDQQTGLLTYVLADGVVKELEAHFNTEIPNREELIHDLMTKADDVFQASARFAKKVSHPVTGRDFLIAFMRHWLGAFIKNSVNGEKIPVSFHNGLPFGSKQTSGIFGRL